MIPHVQNHESNRVGTLPRSRTDSFLLYSKVNTPNTPHCPNQQDTESTYRFWSLVPLQRGIVISGSACRHPTDPSNTLKALPRCLSQKISPQVHHLLPGRLHNDITLSGQVEL